MIASLKINILVIIILLSYCAYGLDDYINQINGKSSIGNIPNNIVVNVSNYYLNNNLGPENYIDGNALRDIRRQFNQNRENLIQEWEYQLNQNWPTYQETTLCIKNNECFRKEIGYKYDAHHLIPASHRGPNIWWNIWPLSSTEHTKVHSQPPCCNIFPKSCGNRGKDIKISEFSSGWTKTGKSSREQEINKKRVLITKVVEGKKKKYKVSVDGEYLGHYIEKLLDAKKEAVEKAFNVAH